MKIILNDKMREEFSSLVDKWIERNEGVEDIINIVQTYLFVVYHTNSGDDWRQDLIDIINTTHFGEGCPCCGGKD